MVFHVNFAGNIAAGKSSLFEGFCCTLQDAGIKVFRLIEDVDRMKTATVRGKVVEPLRLSIDEPARYKASVQLYFYRLRLNEGIRILAEAEEYEQKHPEQVVVVVSERGRDDDRIFYRFGCYAPQENDQVDLETDLEDNLVMDLIDSLNYEMAFEKEPIPVPDINIYVRTDPRECQRRTQNRGRDEDKGLPLDFLVGLHLLHEQVYADVPLNHPIHQEPVDPAKVIILDNDTHVEEFKRNTADHPLLATLLTKAPLAHLVPIC